MRVPDESAATEAAVCQLCHTARGHPVLRTGSFVLVRCDGCGLVRTISTGVEPAARYDGAYYSSHLLADSLLSQGQPGRDGVRARLIGRAYAAYLVRSSSWLLRLLFLPVRNRLTGIPPRWAPGLDLLDVGCGDGEFVHRAVAAGYHAQGQEINPIAVESARRAGLSVSLGELAELGLPTESFDIVRAWHVLEHVPDPLQLLAQVRRLLRPRGLMIVGVPDFASPMRRVFGERWGGLQLPYHIHHFTRATLRRTLEAAGFEIVTLRHRSVGTFYSSLTAHSRKHLANTLTWAACLATDRALDAARHGDALEAVGVRPQGS